MTIFQIFSIVISFLVDFFNYAKPLNMAPCFVLVRGYQGAGAEQKGNLMDTNVDQDAIRELTQRKKVRGPSWDELMWHKQHFETVVCDVALVNTPHRAILARRLVISSQSFHSCSINIIS